MVAHKNVAAEIAMYSVHDYGTMIADRVRMEAYSEALRQAIRPDAAVLDLGTGAGIFALLACRFGARHVYAIEPSNIIEVGREIAAANDCGDRITFVQQRSERVRLPERVDVIVSDLRGVLPCLAGNLRTFVDARERFLNPGGTVIARRDTLWAAVVEAPDLYRSHFVGWDETTLGFDQQAARRILANSWAKGRVLPEQFLTEPCCWATLDYQTVASPDLHADVVWTAARAGTAHGLVIWFDALLAEGVGFSNAPGQPPLIYGTAFFPWPEPVHLTAGDTVTVNLEARLAGEDSYVWSWVSCVGGPGQARVTFRQTTLLGEAVSSEMFKRRAVQYKPVLGEEGHIDQFVLSAMNGRTSLGTIAHRMLVRFPGRFENLKAAMSRAAELSARYSGES
jgi:SAM-dependent methyltransferase